MKNLLAVIFLTISFSVYAECDFDKEYLLSMDLNTFDQDLVGGWRKLAEKTDCKSIAADIIAEYRIKNKSADTTLFWHEGQIRAELGQTKRAIVLFEKSREPKELDPIGWNYYVDATVAFLNKDKKALLQSREMLSKVEMPKDLEMVDVNGNKMEMAWPPNLNIVDKLLKCFDKDYSFAYNNCN